MKVYYERHCFGIGKNPRLFFGENSLAYFFKEIQINGWKLKDEIRFIFFKVNADNDFQNKKKVKLTKADIKKEWEKSKKNWEKLIDKTEE